MSTLTTIHGDATLPRGTEPRIICHGCNDLGIWGAGFVLAVSKRYPQAEQAYRTWAQKVGTLPLGECQLVDVGNKVYIANIISQTGVGITQGNIPLRYGALETGLFTAAYHAQRLSGSLHMPTIGAGLAGGDWDRIYRIIERMAHATQVPVTIYLW